MSLADATMSALQGHWDDAFTLLRSAAASGDADARRQLEVLGTSDPNTILEPPPKERIHDVSAIFVCRGFATPAMCDHLIESTRDRQRPSLTHNSNSGEVCVDESRTALSAGAAFDCISLVIQERAARLTRVPRTHHETPNVISYEVGQQFDYHHDYFDPNEQASMSQLLMNGQRTITIVTYLNTEYEGATTDFPRLGLSFKGQKGDAIVFSNVLPNGWPDTNTWHAGLPPTSGRKWVLSQWIRNRAQLPQ